MLSIVRFHPAVVHFPIALLIIAGLIGLVYLIRPFRSEFRFITWWAMLGGWIGTAVAIGSGLLAQSGLSPDAPFRSLLNWHIGTGLGILVLFGFILYRAWLYTTPKARKRRPATAANDLLDDPRARGWLAVLLVVGIVLVVISGWSGGELVFAWGVNVSN